MPSITPRPFTAVPPGIKLQVAVTLHAAKPPRILVRRLEVTLGGSGPIVFPWTRYDRVILLGVQLKLHGAAAASTKPHKAIRGAGASASY